LGKKLKISKQLNSIIIIDGCTHSFCKINEIVLIKSEKDYIRIYKPDASCLVLGTLNRICTELPSFFVRSHRSYIINIKKIKEIIVLSKSRYLAIMSNNMEIPITRSALLDITDFFV